MKLNSQRFLTFLLAFFMLASCLLPGMIPLQTQADEYSNNHVNTGDQRADIIAVALSQIGYTEVGNNETKYGAWYGIPNQPWCAAFITWCAVQADISSDIIHPSAVADPGKGYFDIPEYNGETYTPKPGDIFFTKKYEHVGFVYYVDGDYFYTIEGNTNVHDPDRPAPSDVEGLYVMTNRRRTKDYYFGVPNYKGGDKDHTYVKGQDSTHPHKTFYACSTCGDKYYTGYTAHVPTCGSCYSCGCTPADGYYMVSCSSEYLNIRAGHGTDYGIVGCTYDGEVVRLLGTNGYGWAYVEYDGRRGHVPTSYLEKYYAAPLPPTVTSDKDKYIQGQNAALSWNLPGNTENIRIEIYKDGKCLVKENLGTKQTFTITSVTEGTYEARIYAINQAGTSLAGTRTFNVLNVYRVNYNLRGGTNGPETQSQTMGQVMNLSATVPTLADHTFLGWTDNADSKFVTYKPGDSFIANNDVTLYAVWKQNSATLDTLSIDRLPAQTRYLKGDTLNTSGLTLKLGYSDGSGQLVTNGFTTTGFDSDRLGTKTITVTYGDKTVSFDVQIMTYIPGDVNEDRLVDRDDVMQLLWHISFPEKFPVNVNADFKEDGKVNRDDVMQLLWHVAFPDKFSVPDINTHTHKWTAATCHEPKFCTTCGATEGNAAGHTWKDATCSAPKTCATCGATEGNAAGHTWTDATCSAPKTCATCGATEGNAAGHTWTDATCSAPKTCKTCGATEGNAAGHTWQDATCTAPKTCATCGATEGNVAGHTWTDATCTAPKTCGTCGSTEGEALGHDHVEDAETGSLTCSRCGDTVANDDSNTDPSDDTTPSENTTAPDTDTPEE